MGGASRYTDDATEFDKRKDRFNASLCLTAIGIGYLFPFSALTQPVDYWNYLFPGENMGAFVLVVI